MGRMGPGVFATSLAVAAAVLAVWLDQRLGDGRPRALRHRLLHVVLAFVALNLATAVPLRLAGPDAASLQRGIVIFLIVLPGLLYAFLACLWLLRSLAESTAHARH